MVIATAAAAPHQPVQPDPLWRSVLFLKPGLIVGRWELVDRLGQGSTAQVWRALDRERSESVAVKILTHPHPDQRTRFLEVIEFHRQHALPGIIPLLEAYTPTEGDPWCCFSMPIGTPMMARLGKSPGLRGCVEPIAAVARHLATLHGLGVTHSDINKEHIFWVGDSWVLVDFGMSGWPGRRREVGPSRTTRRPFPFVSAEAETEWRRSEDVERLGRVLRELVGLRNLPGSTGFRDRLQRVSLADYIGCPALLPIHELISVATDMDQHARCSMAYFALRLSEWLEEWEGERLDGAPDTE